MVMNMKHRLSVFLLCARMGFRHMAGNKLVIFGSFLIYAVIMLMYAGVIKLIPDADLAPFGFSHAQMIWYLGTTEFLLFSSNSWSFKEVQSSFQSGEAYLGMLRPTPLAFVRFSFWTGESFLYALILFPLYFCFMGVLSGVFVMEGWHVLGLWLSMPMASVMMNSSFYIIGASCLWFVQAEPAFWIWQKLIFLLGALLWPLFFYPHWAQEILQFLPFYGILAHGGNWTLDLPAATYAFGFLNQAVWAILFLLFLRWFDRVILRRVQKGEGLP
jgi:ABC-2 type transport system permease protein